VPGLASVLLGEEVLVDPRRFEHCRVEDRMPAEETLVGQHVARAGCLDQERVDGGGSLEAPHRAARQDDVVAGRHREMPEVAVQISSASVHEQQLVTIGVAREARHPAR